MCRRAGTRHHNTVRGVTFLSHAWGIQPITTHWIAGQSEHASLLRTMTCKNHTFQKGGAGGATIMYSMWKIMCFFNLKPHKHIALHQIHQIMLFFSNVIYPFNRMKNLCNFAVIYTYIYTVNVKFFEVKKNKSSLNNFFERKCKLTFQKFFVISHIWWVFT